MLESQPTSAGQTRGHRWRQVAIVSTLLLLLVSGIVMGSIRFLCWREWKQAAAVARVERCWGAVEYNIDRVEPNRRTLLREFLGDRFFGHVIGIRARPGVQCNLRDLMDLPEVEQLELTCAQVNATELAHLRSLPKLRILSLDGTNVADADLKQIEVLTDLKWLDLSRSQITDSGLQHLKPLRRLRLLFVTDTCVTEAGMNKLRSLLPHCEIEGYGQTNGRH